MEITHIPRGFMCCVCEKALENCSKLPFNTMQVIHIFKDDKLKEVKCSDFKEKQKNDS
jgi:hypothetical protein